jgi:hypothetical protein
MYIICVFIMQVKHMDTSKYEMFGCAYMAIQKLTARATLRLCSMNRR